MANPERRPRLLPQAPLDQLPLNAVFGSYAASVVPSLIFPGRDSSAYCRTMMAILNAKEKPTPNCLKYSRLTYRPTNHLAGTLASRHSYKRNFEPPYIAGTQLCSRLEPPYLCYGFLIYFLLFHVHCFFWLQCMMDVYEKKCIFGKTITVC